eukprot:TRINITY_DN23659_c0_g1_i3.p1 TRINITY_DN23659_c0_g1~~TRINITY_DN23659_c0_g1_i3.p1  ORF type:complete len:124 (+),score=20.27 TRINITY_DN23659_c0_g1_i3:65-436(+)
MACRMLQRRWLRTETYPWKQKKKSALKQSANLRLAELASLLVAARTPAESSGDHELQALVLDASSLSSSRALGSGAKFKPERITVPLPPRRAEAAFGRTPIFLFSSLPSRFSSCDFAQFPDTS